MPTKVYGWNIIKGDEADEVNENILSIDCFVTSLLSQNKNKAKICPIILKYERPVHSYNLFPVYIQYLLLIFS